MKLEMDQKSNKDLINVERKPTSEMQSIENHY